VIKGALNGGGLVDGVTVQTGDSWVGLSLTLRNVHFEQGARLQTASEVRIENSTFSDVSSAIILHAGASLVVQGSRFSGVGGVTGAALYVSSGATATVDSCTFVNSFPLNGMFEVAGGTLRVQNSLIAENQNKTGSVGMFVVSGGSFELISSTIAYNTTKASLPSAVFTISGSPTITATNDIFWGNSGVLSNAPLTVTYSIVEGGQAGTGNLSATPVFTGIAPHPYQLDFSSAGIDAANGDVAPARDLTGQRRVDTTYPNTGTGTPAYADIGAYEWHR